MSKAAGFEHLVRACLCAERIRMESLAGENLCWQSGQIRGKVKP